MIIDKAFYLYDSLSGQKRLFQPRDPGQVGIYACGMTVYDECHIGHARGMLCFDVLVRFFKGLNYQVNYVRNITDIDDKIIKRAQERDISASQLSDQVIASMHRDCRALGLLQPDHEPRATAYIQQMIELIGELEQRNLAYSTASGDVCFAVHDFADYGKLSHRSLDQLLAGARVATQQDKRNALDFVLWKHAKPGEPSWDSPWGPGRPGWHIECSTMSTALLGESFDIHGGGMDLKFPHHENEIAQSEGVCDAVYARNWMHIGLVQVDGEKMSKSLGNFRLIRQVLEDYAPEVVRYWMIASHYRSPVNFTANNLQQAQQALRRLYTAIAGCGAVLPCTVAALYQSRYPAMQDFLAAMHDDLNTPLALSCLFDLAGQLNRHKQQQQLEQALALAAELLAAGQLLGLLQQPPQEFLQGDVAELDIAAIEVVIAKRQQARAAKDWALADQLRDQLAEQGIELDDSPSGETSWKKL